MNAAMLFGRGISFPPRIAADGRLAWSTGAANVAEAIQVILLTEPGERLLLPEFGGHLRRFLYESNTVATRRLIAAQIESALKAWEPRVSLESVDVQPDPDDDRAALATIRYALVANRASETLTLRVQLTG